MTRREYAASLGLAIAGARGRLSREANAACDKAESEGMVFDSTAPVKHDPMPTDDKPTPKAKSSLIPAGSPEREPVFPNDYKAFSLDGKHSCSLTNACFNCGVSLYYCVCKERGMKPKALVTNTSGYIPVVIGLTYKEAKARYGAS